MLKSLDLFSQSVALAHVSTVRDLSYSPNDSHGQLPPVKQSKVYDWSGVKVRTGPGQSDRYLEKAPRWESRGVKMYEEIINQGSVFFLDQIERAKDEAFKALQLRARDGELTAADAKYIRESMVGGECRAEFNGPDVYRLVSTRRERDELNAEQLERAIDEGRPSIVLEATNSSRAAAEADEDQIRLPNELILTIGARVMILHNLCVAHGLVNGTTGFVHDVICDGKGKATAVLVVLKRRTPTSDGYSGPSFLNEADGVDMSTHAIVAIGLHTAELYRGDGSRTQFPLTLVRDLSNLAKRACSFHFGRQHDELTGAKCGLRRCGLSLCTRPKA